MEGACHLLVAFILGACMSVAPARAADSDTSIRIEVADIDAHSLAFVVADGLKANLLIDPFVPRRRISFSKTYQSSSEVLDSLAELTGGITSRAGSFILIRAGCRPPALTLAKSGQDQAISLYFQTVQLGTLLTLADLSSKPSSHQWHEGLLQQTMTIRAKNVLKSELGAALAAAAGTVVTDEGVSAPKGASDCAPVQDLSQTAGGRALVLHPRNDHCPYRSLPADTRERSRRCQPLEYYALHTLRPLGFVRVGANHFAMLETPDNLLYALRVGDYLGRDYGKVIRISDEGVQLNEIVPDAGGTYVERPVLLRFGVPADRQVVASGYYIEEGSPQYNYEAALGRLFSAARYPVAVADFCMKRQLVHVPSVAEALAGWKWRNSSALDEISRHNEAYLQRRSAESSESTDKLQARYQSLIDEHVVSMVEREGGPASEGAQRQCLALAVQLLDERRDIANGHAGDLRVLHACGSESTCPNLATGSAR